MGNYTDSQVFTSITEALAMDLITSFEGLKLTSYKCPAGVWTIGWGHTGKDVGPGMTITVQEANDRLRRTVKSILSYVSARVTVSLPADSMAALVSFAYNVGCGAFASSSLLKYINKGQFKAVPGAFELWNKVNGVVSKGLTLRRKKEAEMFMAGLEKK